jgi:hypothetical protein
VWEVLVQRRIVNIREQYAYISVLSHLLRTWRRDRAMAQAVSCRHLTSEAGFDLGSVHVGFVVDKLALGQVFL